MINWNQKKNVDWIDANIATPKFYGKPNGNPFGSIALTEGTKTTLPKNSQLEYKVNGKTVM